MKYGDNRDYPAKLKTKYASRIESTVRVFNRYYKAPGKVVDVGSRTGYAVELLDWLGFDAIGIDLVQDCVDYAVEHGRNVIQDDITASNLPSDTFDFVFSRHCIEHCLEPEKFLSEAVRILSRHGKVFITFPLETKEQMDKNEYHLSYFEHKDDFRAIARKLFKEIEFCKSKSKGIITDGKEVLFIGEKIAG